MAHFADVVPAKLCAVAPYSFCLPKPSRSLSWTSRTIRLSCGGEASEQARLSDLRAVQSRHHTVAQVVTKLRCQQCHRPPGRCATDFHD